MKLILPLLLLSFSVFAEVSKEHVDDMLKQMVRENVISAEEAQKARIRMNALSKDQWGKINQEASKIAASNRAPASVESSNRIEEVHKIDLDGAQFKQIQNDIKKIIPEYRD
jgi:hypothetical protein